MRNTWTEYRPATVILLLMPDESSRHVNMPHDTPVPSGTTTEKSRKHRFRKERLAHGYLTGSKPKNEAADCISGST